MEFGLSPIPGFLFLCPFLRFGSARTQFPAAPTFFYFQPLLFRGVCCPAFSSELLFLLSELFFFLLGCCLPSEVSGALLPFSFAFLPRLLSSPPFPCALFLHALFLHALFPHALFPACPLSRTPFFRASFPARSLSRALSFPRASFCTPSFRASRTFLPRLHSSRLEPSPQLEHSPTGNSAERNGSGWNGSKWGSNVCAIVFGASTGPSRAVYVTKLLNIFRILLKGTSIN